MKLPIVVALSLATSLFSFYRIMSRRARTYQFVKVIAHDPKVKECCEQLQDKYAVPAKPGAIEPPKPVGVRGIYTYPTDEHDQFAFDSFEVQNERQTKVIILPFIGGHSKSGAIRRMVQVVNSMGFSAYVLIQRGMMGTKLDPKQRAFHMYASPEDILQFIKFKNLQRVVLVGYSIGSFQSVNCFRDAENAELAKRIKAVFAAFLEFEPLASLQLPKRAQLAIGSAVVNVVKENQQFYENHGFSKEEIAEVLTRKRLRDFDGIIAAKAANCKSLEEYYDSSKVHSTLPKITAPTLFFATADDNVCGLDFPEAAIQENTHLNYAMLNMGSHLGSITPDGGDITSKLAGLWIDSLSLE